MLLIINLNPTYDIAATLTTKYLSMSLVLSHFILWSAMDVVGLRHSAFENIEVGCASGIDGTRNCHHGIKSVVVVSLPLAKWKCLLLLQLEHNALNRQHLLLPEIGTYSHQPRVGYYRLVQYILLLVATYTIFDVVSKKPTLIFQIVRGIKLLFSPLYVGARVP